MEKKEQEVAEEYLSSLADLNLNSKPLINMLTILAEENIEFAPVIVKAVEQHIAKVNPDVKLPVLYLIDSIVKNVGREYVQLFSHSIVNIFCGVFEKVNEKIREKMYTLRQTWTDVFTPQKLYTLDVKVNCMDPNWPITAKVVPKSPAIHVNPNFLKNKSEPLNEMEAKLRDKQRQLLELQKRKLELELAATKQRLEEQEKQLQSTIQTDTTKAPAPTAAATVVHPAICAKQTLNGPLAKSQQSKMLSTVNPPAMVNQNTANNMVPKIRVAPVNSALLNSVRQRDPRLVRQQQQQAVAALAAATSQQQAMSSNAIEMPTNLMPSGSTTMEMPRADNNAAERSMHKPLYKSGVGNSVGREKSKDVSTYNASMIRRQQRRNSEKPSYIDGKKSPTPNVQSSPTSLSRNSKNQSSSSSRGSGMSRSRENSKSSNSREKSSLNYERERKRKSESSPIKSGRGPKQSEKSPKRYVDHSLKLPPSSTGATSVSVSPTKFQDASKQHTKSRNYMRRNREKSASPKPPPSPPSASNHYPDLRETFSSSSPEKRLKISSRGDIPTLDSVGNSSMIATSVAPTTVTVSVATVSKVGELGNNNGPLSVTLAAPPGATSSNINAEKLEQSVELTTTSASLTGDTDLRQLHSNAVASLNASSATATTSVASESVNCNNNQTQEESPEDADNKKRAAIKDAEEPVPKKTRSEKIDPLFGTEDVDLRTLNAPGNHINVAVPPSMPATPPPPPIISNESENWAKVKGDKPNKQHPLPKSKLDDVRAKLAKATKEQHKIEKDPKSFKKASRFNETHDDSQDGTDTNIRTIMSQAQEMLQSDNMDADQYNTLVKTVIQINETSKLKEAQRRESLLIRKDGNEDFTPISDEEVPFSSDDDSTQSSLKSSKAKVLSKRIPKVTRKDENAPTDIKFEQNSVLRRSPTPTGGGTGNSYSDGNSRVPSGVGQQGPAKPEKRNRQKDSKWSRWEPPIVPPQPTINNNKPKWVVGNPNFRPPFPGNMDNANEMANRPAVPSPWQNPPQIIFAGPPVQNRILPPPPIPPMVNPMIGPDRSTVTPGPPIPPPIILPQLSNSVDNPNADVVRTINIDGVPKEIRFYDEIAIAFMDWDQPKEIGFQAGQRRILIDDHDVASLSFNDVYKTVMIDGTPHQMRFGCPTRELYIDKNWYECYFGDPPIRICLDGRMRVCKVEGPSPQVRIGNTRQDLVIGKINMIVDALIIVPVFLDAKVQSFQLDDTTHTVQFADNLNTVLINNIPFEVEYGGLPKSMYLNGVKHFVRFGTLPKGIVPGGNVLIQNMLRTERFSSIEPPLSSPQDQKPAVVVPTQLPPIEAVLPAMGDVKPQVAVVDNTAEMAGPIKTDPIMPPLGNVNIDDLFQKLLASGILNQNQDGNKTDESKKEKKDKPITPINLTRPETIKTRQAGIIQKLFSGMQCSSCGVRFPPEQTMKYSQHLDWHFRQNRKERDNSRRAHSRKWYYEVSDWIQYEEIEDLEEREKNWFETQQNDLDNVDENSNQRTNSPPPSCPAGPDGVDKCCDMCHDKFEQFYNEESEEWHLRNAVRVDDKLYHPICYEDYKASLTMALEESNLALGDTTDDNAMDVVVVKSEKKDGFIEGESIEIATIDDDDEDDVIVLPTEEPSIQEIPDDDEDVVEQPMLESELLVPDSETNSRSETTEEEKEASKKSGEAMESDDVEIQEPHIPFTDLDTYEETAAQSVSTVDDSSQSSQFNVIKIKEEPKDDGYNEDDDFEEVGTIMCDDDISAQTDDGITVVRPPVVISPPAPAVSKAPITSTSNSNILILHDPASSAEGDADIHENHTTTLGSNKIKINISTSAIRSESVASATQSSSNPLNTVDESSTCYDNAASSATSQEKDDFYDSIEYTLKPSLQNVSLKKTPRTVSGLETSGLCSIM